MKTKQNLLALICAIAALGLNSCTSKIEGNDFTVFAKKENRFAKCKPILNANGDLNHLIDSLKYDRKKINVHIEKLTYTMYVVHDTLLLKKYKVVLGFNPTDDKLKQGDGCTPEGVFGIRAKYPHSSWSKFIWIDYPNKESWNKFKKAKLNGTIPRSATIGGEVGIHGVPKDCDYLIEQKENWTLGCISLKRNDIDELYNAVSSNTKIYIFK